MITSPAATPDQPLTEWAGAGLPGRHQHRRGGGRAVWGTVLRSRPGSWIRSTASSSPIAPSQPAGRDATREDGNHGSPAGVRDRSLLDPKTSPAWACGHDLGGMRCGHKITVVAGEPHLNMANLAAPAQDDALETQPATPHRTVVGD